MTVLNDEINRDALLENNLVSPEKLAHVVLRTAPQNVESMVAFYKTFLNARPAYENKAICFLRYDDEHHRLVIIGIPGLGEVAHRNAGLEHIAFTYTTMGELLGNYVRLKQLNIHPVWCINHGFTTSIYYQDPDGNMLETQFDNMDNDDADAFMAGEYFNKNPIGVDFDPEKLLQRYQNGDPISELVKMRSALYEDGVPHIKPSNLPPYDCNGDLL